MLDVRIEAARAQRDPLSGYVRQAWNDFRSILLAV